MKLFLIRHGQTVTNLEQRWTGQSEVALTEQGRREAEEIAPILAEIPFNKVFSSDLSRAVITQQLALPGYTAEQTKLLREFDVGSLEGKLFAEVPVEQRKSYEYYGGESVKDVCDRVRQFLKSLEGQPWENVAAFAHNGILGCAMRVILDADISGAVIRSGNCAIHVFEFDGKIWRLLAWNYMKRV